MTIIYTIIGWIGMVLIVIAYGLLSIKRLKSTSLTYNLMNFLGGIGIAISALVTEAWPAMTLNIIWVIIAVFSIINIKKSLNLGTSRCRKLVNFLPRKFVPNFRCSEIQTSVRISDIKKKTKIK